MNIEELRNHCLAIKNAEESTPFGDDVMVYKIMDKMFAFFPLNPKDSEHFAVLKCDPEKTVELRERYEGVTKGYYAGNNLMWNSVYIQKDVPDELIVELIAHSAAEVFKKLPKKKQEAYGKIEVGGKENL
jgi:predicted DNA-binding protein (MmcQ/YjbR family)